MATYNQPKGTQHAPTKRRTLSGRLVSAFKPRNHWAIAAAPAPSGVKRPFEVDAASITYLPVAVGQPQPGQPSRRSRRPALIAAAKQARKDALA